MCTHVPRTLSCTIFLDWPVLSHASGMEPSISLAWFLIFPFSIIFVQRAVFVCVCVWLYVYFMWVFMCVFYVSICMCILCICMCILCEYMYVFCECLCEYLYVHFMWVFVCVFYVSICMCFMWIFYVSIIFVSICMCIFSLPAPLYVYFMWVFVCDCMCAPLHVTTCLERKISRDPLLDWESQSLNQQNTQEDIQGKPMKIKVW